MSKVFEIIMILCFGVSWPMNVYKSFKVKSNKGKSLLFLIFIFIGYLAGITYKLINNDYMLSFNNKWHVLIFYFINITMVFIDLILYIRNYKLNKKVLYND